MSDGLGGFGQLSLFLTLAFGFPGIVYVGFLWIFFPAEVAGVIQTLNALAPKDTIFASLGGLGALFFLGLTLTSILFALEYVLRKSERVKKHLLPKVQFDRIMLLQMKEKDVSFLLQQTAQGIMHYNIWSGVLALTLLYVGRSWYIGLPLSAEKVAFALAVVISNVVAARLLLGWASNGIEEASNQPREGGPRTISRPIAIGIDVDSVLAEIVEPVLQGLRAKGIGTGFTRKDWVHWDFKIDGTDVGAEIEASLKDPKFVAGLPVIAGSVEAMQVLHGLFYVAIVTSRPVETQSATEEWLRRHFSFHEFTNVKKEQKTKNDTGICILVDDNSENVKAFVGSGGIAVLFTQPWNEIEDEKMKTMLRAQSVVRCGTWPEVVSQLCVWRSLGILLAGPTSP